MISLLLLLVGIARADAVDDPPTDCPNGSEGTTSHSGTWCEPTECSQDADCPTAGKPCVPEVGLCVVVTENVPCGGLQPDSAEPCTFTRREATGTCATSADCSEGTCEVASRCGTTGGILTSCGGCHHEGGPVVGALVAIALLSIAGTRRSV